MRHVWILAALAACDVQSDPEPEACPLEDDRCTEWAGNAEECQAIELACGEEPMTEAFIDACGCGCRDPFCR